MSLPFFYKGDIDLAATEIVLDEATSNHIIQVLRMQVGEQLQLTNGKGNLFNCKIINNNRKKCVVIVNQSINYQPCTINVSIAISLIKNTTRFEWFLEKATEIGVTQIIPLVCKRTEKTTFKFERMKNILVSAMLQSQQCWLPKLNEPTKFENLQIANYANTKKYIAHCINEKNKQPLNYLANKQINQLANKLILIGPEGDFTQQEIEIAVKNNFEPVSLGNTRLRTETAGVVAATIFCIGGN